jgi:hypothetical protein
MEESPSVLTDSGAAPAPVAASAPPPSGPTNPLRLIWSALWFQESAYAEVRDDANPLARGLVIVLLVTIIAGVAGALGVGFDRLTSPDMQSVRQIVLEGLQEMQWYRQMTEGPGGDEFERQFVQNYDLWWNLSPALFGAPSLSGAAAALCLTPVAGVLSWLIAGSITYLAARLLGGKGGFGPTLGVMALATTPQVLGVFTILPGLEVAAVTGWWSLALTYWAVRSAHGLTWQRNLLTVLLARLALALLSVLLVVVGAGALGAFLGMQAAGP